MFPTDTSLGGVSQNIRGRAGSPPCSLLYLDEGVFGWYFNIEYLQHSVANLDKLFSIPFLVVPNMKHRKMNS